MAPLCLNHAPGGELCDTALCGSFRDEPCLQQLMMRVPDATCWNMSFWLSPAARPLRSICSGCQSDGTSDHIILKSPAVALQSPGLEVFSLGGCSVASSRGAASEFEGQWPRAVKSDHTAMPCFRRRLVEILAGRNTSRQGTTLIRHRSAKGRPLAAKWPLLGGPVKPASKPIPAAATATSAPGSQHALRAWPRRV